ncbi:MAG: DUF3298 domain-containing protein [Lachnospiraceae bacterium]|nr:DUF3298 domain-containing protein [Lachnospiraceae bacterium]
MKMFRKYMATFLALAMMAALFGCGGASTSSGSSGGSERKVSEAETTAAQEPAAEESAAEESASEKATSEASSAAQETAASEASAAGEETAENETQAEAPADEAKNADKKSEAAESLPEPVGVLLTSGSLSAYGPFDYKHYAEVIYAKASLTEESAKKYPALAKAMEEWNQKEDEHRRERLRELQEAAKDLLENRPDDTDFFLTSELQGSVLRADSAVVSIFHDYYSFEGGVHPNYSYSGVNFDTETGKELKFTDVVSDPKSFFVLADEVFQEKYAEIYDSMTNVCKYMEEHDPADPEDSGMYWSIDPEGVTVYFNPYILGSYAMGAQTAKIYFEDHPEVFVEKYMKTPESYVIPLIDSQELKIDADGDGKRELFEVQAEPEEPGQKYGYYKWIVNSGSRSLEINDFCYSKECYVVRANDQYYLYLFETSDNDYSILGVVDLKTLKYDSEKYLFASLAGADSYWNDDEATEISEFWNQEYAFTDPGRFFLSEHLDILGTRFGKIPAKVGKDGYPEYTDPWYTLQGTGVLQAMTDLECDYVDEQGKLPETEYVDKNGHETDHGTLEKGTYVIAVRTDGKTWIDLQEIPASKVTDERYEDYSFIYTEETPTPDYSELTYRIYVDDSEWPHKAAGMEETEAFRGIQYAG